MRRWQSFLVIASLALAGCGKDLMVAPAQAPASPPATARGQTPSASLADPPPASPARVLTFVQVKMVVLQLPLGTISKSDEVWNYLNEEPVISCSGNSLRANGIRVGVGKISDWPELATLLTNLSGRELTYSNIVLKDDRTTPVNLKQEQPLQTIFLCKPDGTLAGADYPPGDNVMVMSGAVSMDDLKTVLLTANLAIQSSDRQMQYEKTPAGYTFAAEQHYYPLPGMQFRLAIKPGGMLFIAPSSQAARSSSPGHRFLLRDRDGLTFETVLVFIPQAGTAPWKEHP